MPRLLVSMLVAGAAVWGLLVLTDQGGRRAHAAAGTWFRNAHSVYDSTTRAIPAVLDGKLPRRRFSADYRTHRRTVYDLFGPRGYRIVRHEEATSLCPPRYCRGARPRRPAILPLLAA